MRNKSSGFTLIEVLVVVAIIGLISAVVLGTFNTARMKGRDARRYADMHSVIQALQLYATYNNGAFPLYSASPAIRVLSTAFGSSLSPYMSTLPVDPTLSGNQGYRYCSSAPGTGYDLIIYNEMKGISCKMQTGTEDVCGDAFEDC